MLLRVDMQAIRLYLRKINLFSPMFLNLILAVFIRLYYFLINVSPIGIDGGLYRDFARTIAKLFQNIMSASVVTKIGKNGFLGIFL